MHSGLYGGSTLPQYFTHRSSLALTISQGGSVLDSLDAGLAAAARAAVTSSTDGAAGARTLPRKHKLFGFPVARVLRASRP